jgi:eukaryotic-like serine/threonine-protein kinase
VTSKGFMEGERQRQISQLYHAALLRVVSERAAFVREACSGDDALLREVESLLALDSSAQNLLNTPAAVAAAGIMTDGPGISLIGRQLGAYRVDSLLGAGGMGEVYRARDTKLGREVAMKVLPPVFASDANRLARFEREARLLATLNHPHIGAIYGLEDAAGVRALILELVEGPTLADRLSGGPLPVREALTIGRQIAEALEAAHEKGVIHRDLKPANIKVTPDGVVKVLDFGLAKAATGDGSTPDLTQSPTVTVGGTRDGIVLGTAAYMSPEQARGQAVDKRGDIWAFGCVLWEMITGRAPFARETMSETLAAILEREPDWSALPPATPESIRRLLTRSLQKDPQRRLRHIGDARIEIEEAKSEPRMAGIAAQGSPRNVLAWISSSAILTLIATLVGTSVLRSTVPAPEVRFEISTPPTPDPASLAISPDGQQTVFVATSEGRPRLWLRSLDAVSPRPLVGTDGGFYPFWSPDNRSIGFFADGKLQRIDIEGGLVRTLAIAPNPEGASWNRDGTILFVPNATGPIFRTSATGGEVEALTRIEAKQSSHRFPQFLPDGRHFLYYVTGSPQVSGVYVNELNGTTKRLLDADAPASYTPSQYLLFVRQGTLFAQSFDPVKLEVSGNPLPIAEQIAVGGETSAVALSASAAGPFLYRSGLASAQRQFIWFDRSGKQIEKLGDLDSTTHAPSLSPDRLRLALNRTLNGNTDVWTLDLGRSLLSRFTFDVAADTFPIWSPDGDRIVFNSNRQGAYDLYEKRVTGSGNERLLLATPQNKAPVDWSPDGRFVLYRSPTLTTGFDLWALPMDGTTKPFPVVQTNFEERDGQFSPDGKWIAYQSNESGRSEIVVQPFPGPGDKLQISTNGGGQVRWPLDGKELFYIALDGRLMAVPIRMASNGQSIEAAPPVPLFATRVGGGIQVDRQQYVVSPDGRRFLMNTLAEGDNPSPITVILNWRPKP